MYPEFTTTNPMTRPVGSDTRSERPSGNDAVARRQTSGDAAAQPAGSGWFRDLLRASREADAATAASPQRRAALIGLPLPATARRSETGGDGWWDNDEAPVDTLAAAPAAPDTEAPAPSSPEDARATAQDRDGDESPDDAPDRDEGDRRQEDGREATAPAQPLVIPVGTKVRFLITSADVIHSWWVPQLAVKKDAIPGFVNASWTRIPEPGIYRGQCAELCGKNHGFMPIVVSAVAQDEFKDWLAQRKGEAEQERALMAQTFTMDELMARGEAVYTKTCAACHMPTGMGVPGAFPALKGSAIATGPLDGHLDIVVNGKQGTAMAAFGAQFNEIDLAAVITYERNSWGNNMGDMLQPIDVAKFKKAK